MAKAITELMSELADATQAALDTSIHVERRSSFPAKISDLPLKAGCYWRLDDVAVVSCDLKGSTRISYSKQDRVAARIYEASTGNCVRVLREFEPNFVDIQGDGVYALYHGDLARERAMAAALTLKSFSNKTLGGALDKLFKEAVEESDPDGEPFHSGLKIGAAVGTLLAKRVGVRGEHNEPVWAGKPVNFAVKCAQAADRHGVIVTERFFEHFKANDFVLYSCGCSGEPRAWWQQQTVETIGADGATCWAFPAHTNWCADCGDRFASAIRSGKSRRDELTDDQRKAAQQALEQEAA